MMGIAKGITGIGSRKRTKVRQQPEHGCRPDSPQLPAERGMVHDIYVQIEPFKKRKAGKLSGGMKQKLALSCALIHRPEVLFLDEPTTGVDPVSRVEFWDMLDRLKRQGITIMVSTPYMDEASRCDRIALMRSGQCLSVDTPAGISDKILIYYDTAFSYIIQFQYHNI